MELVTGWPRMAADAPPRALDRLRALGATVRVRTTLGAVAVVGAALLLASVALVVVLRETLTSDRRELAETRAEEVAGTIRASGVPATVTATEDDQLVQLVNEAGNVVAASSNVAGRPPVAQLRPGQSSEVHLALDEAADFVVVARGVDSPGGRLTVLVAHALDDVTEATQALTGLLAIGLPVLLLVVGFTSWKISGRALAPVEAIRHEVDEISAQELHRRVPEPPGDDEIARLAATMNRMLRRLHDSQIRQRRFVSDASHELRSPVASIRQHAEVALAHTDRTTVSELAETVLAEDLRVQQLVEDLLLLARADERTLSAADQVVDLDDLVFEEARRLRETSRLQVDGSAVSAGRVRGEPAQLRRMIRNLVDNASRHARARITLSLSEDHAGAVVLRVDDDGEGIPATERDRVFQRFVRLDDARARDQGGSGLGLAIVAEVAAHHGGSVRATDAPGGGARLEIRLPLLAD